MTSSENKFEKQWQEAFNDASFTPPDALWERIAEQLDEDKKQKPFFMLWGMPAYFASGIAATLILALSGLYFFRPSDTVASKNNVAKTEIKPEQTKQPDDVVESVVQPAEVTTANAPLASNKTNKIFTNKKQVTVALNSDNQYFNTIKSADVALTSEIKPQESNDKSFLEKLSTILGKEVEKYTVHYTLKRNKLGFEIKENTASEKVTPERRTWIGLISGISPFKPNFQSGNLNALAASSADAFKKNDANFSFQESKVNSSTPGQSVTGDPSLALPNSAPVQQFSVGRAINLGIQAGKKLTKHLALEAGLRYLQGNAPANTNVYTLNQTTGDINTFYQDYLSNGKSTTNAVVAIEDVVRNEYEYLIIPVQLAYQIPLSKKLNVEVLGGVSADAFLKNTLESESTDIATLTSSNSAFRSVGMSGLGGVRVNYSLDDKWELSIGSGFQRAIVSNFNSATSAKLRPQMLGVNYGVNYHF